MTDQFDLSLVCDLKLAASYYEVDIDEIEIKQYFTPFSVTQEESKGTLSLSCTGCNEIIKIHVIEIPRINNFKSIRFIIQLIIIGVLLILPQIELDLVPLALYALGGFALVVFFIDVHTFIIKPPAKVETMFFWHDIIKQSMATPSNNVIYPETITNR